MSDRINRNRQHGKCLVCEQYLKSPNVNQICAGCRILKCKECGDKVVKYNIVQLNKKLCAKCSSNERRRGGMERQRLTPNWSEL